MMVEDSQRGPRIVVVGGSSAPSLIADGLNGRSRKNLTAIVATTDTGSSTGVIRRNFSIPAPGDLRCVISRMSGLRGSDSILKDLFEHRLHPSEIPELDNMAFGNLFITAMAQMTNDFEKAIETTCRLLRVKGKVLPVTSKWATLAALLEDGKEVVGEEAVRSTGKARIRKIYLKEEGIETTSACIEAISSADLIALGPGCLYTSLMACVVVEGIVRALSEAKGKKVYICNTTTTPGQTEGFNIVDHVREVMTYLGDGVLDSVLINDCRPPEEMTRSYEKEGIEYMELTPDQKKELGCLGPNLISGDLIERGWMGTRLLHKRDTIRHDPKRIVKALLRLVIVTIFLMGPLFSPAKISASSDPEPEPPPPSLEVSAYSDPEPPPPSLIDEEGAFHEGWYSAPISDINIDDAQLEGIWGREPFLRNFRKKISLLYRIDNPQIFLTMGLTDAGYLGYFFGYLYEKESKRLTSYRLRSFFGLSTTVSQNSMEDNSGFSNNQATILFINRDDQGKREIHSLIAKTEETPPFLCNLTIQEDPERFPPLVLVRKLQGSQGIYYHKMTGMMVEGKIVIGDRTYNLPKKTTSAILDWSVGYPLYQTEWQLASAIGQSEQGQPLAIDLTLHKDGEKKEDSAFYWINGKLFRAEGIKFEQDEADQSWKISSTDGQIRLTFVTGESHNEQLNLGPIGYRFVQNLGSFQGEILSPDGRQYKIDKMFGVIEQWKSQW